MRLTCPNCGAQYEVPDDVIPEEGRDVQCSACGTTWFQDHGRAQAAGGVSARRPSLPPEAEAEDDQPPLRRPRAPARDDQSQRAPAREQVSHSAPAETPDMPDTAPHSRGVTPDVADILQEEAEFEARMRREEAGGLETQPDLGLDTSGATAARDRMQRDPAGGPGGDVDQAVAATVAAAAADSATRRDRLPDIDEINSSLRAKAEPAAAPGDTDPTAGRPPRRSGFARGFSVALIIVVLALLLYANAGAVAQAVPALGPVLSAYVDFIDGLRIWLDTTLAAFMP